MTDTEFAIRSRRVVTPLMTGPASIQIRGGAIERLGEFDEHGSQNIIDFGTAVVMPGLVDSHVHINQPGRTHWEGFHSATRAAAAGGVTTLVDMPLNSIPATTSVDALRIKVAEAAGNCYVDLGFWGGVVPGNTPELSPMYSDGVVGFKCFLVDSGVAEFPNVNEGRLREAMAELSRLGALLIVHAEMPGPIEHACSSIVEGNLDPRQYRTFLRSRPAEAEDAAVNLIVRLSRQLGTRVHIVHHSSASSLSAIGDAKAEGLNITAETCPHYLAFAAEEIPDGATQFKCCPPIRESANRDALWNALRSGTIDMVVSDHSPCPPEMKELETGDFMRAWGGISSLQFRLPVMWSLARARNTDFSVLAKWLCSAPANLIGLGQRKGQIAAGFDADLVVWNPETRFELTQEQVIHRHKLSPYVGQELYGAVEATYLRGERIYSEKGIEEGPRGELLISGERKPF